jgi:hypothetical protein
MPRRVSITKEDANQAAARIVALSTGQPRPKLAPKKKNPAAVALGKLGGSKGGKKRAENLSQDRRKEIAKLGAQARWSGQ